MGFKERIRAAWDAFWAIQDERHADTWAGYCMRTPRCILDAGHPGRCEE